MAAQQTASCWVLPTVRLELASQHPRSGIRTRVRVARPATSRRSGACHVHSGSESVPERNKESVRRALEGNRSLAQVTVDPEPLSLEERRRLNEGPDAEFYSNPCLAFHVDDGFREKLTGDARKLHRAG